MAKKRSKRRRTPSQKQDYPGWVWMIFGLAIGLSVAFAIYVRDGQPAAPPVAAKQPASLESAIDDNGEQPAAAASVPAEEPQERALMTTLSRYPEVVDLAATNLAPQHLVHYLRDLANDFHTYYNAHVFIVDEDQLRDARLTLCAATRQVIANGLAILGVSAPDSM